MSINLVPEYMLPKSSFIDEELSSTGGRIASDPAWTVRAELDNSLAVFKAVARSSSHDHDCALGDRAQPLALSIL
jgi:hypothetical protein